MRDITRESPKRLSYALSNNVEARESSSMGHEKNADDPCPGIAAATLILFSETQGQPARHLMIQRSPEMRFAPNALVFPGGRVDEDDHRIANDPALVDVSLEDLLERAHRVAAIREMLEEVGILVGALPSDSLNPGAMQASLKAGNPFSVVLSQAVGRLDLSVIVPWAKWHPRFQSHRRFDTRFYIARHHGDHSVTVDEDEVGHARWVLAEEAIADAEAGAAKIIFPTLCNLERLAAFPAFDAAAAHLATIALEPISPQLHDDEHGERWISIPEDRGYPIARRPLSTLQAP